MNATMLAFDRLASQYDALADGELFTLMRRRTHEVFLRWFRPGCRVLDIGCGTGLDTAFLAAHGVRVVACDPSEAMVGRTLNRLAAQGVSARTTVMPSGLHNIEMFLDALGEREPFDGIVSNFGALNCVQCLEPLHGLARNALRPGGAVILGLMSRTCAIETLYFALTGRRELLRRRRSDMPVLVPVAGVQVPTFYHRTANVAAALSHELNLVAITGIGVLLPPPYLEPRWQRLPAFVRTLLATIDSAIASLPPFNRLGDHVLLQFTKRRDADA
jgi:SAM-dependent methyltransferase